MFQSNKDLYNFICYSVNENLSFSQRQTTGYLLARRIKNF